MIRKSLLLTVLTASFTGAFAHSATYAVDPSHSSAIFEIDHMGTSTNRGRIGATEGTIQVDRAAKSGKVEITLNTSSVQTVAEGFSKHLQGPDFFNSAQHPTAKFVSDRFTFNGDKVSEVAGQLTLLGKTNPVVLKATKFNCYVSPMIKREVCGGDFETTIARSQWGMSWGTNFGITDNVRLLVQVEAIKQP